MDHDGLLAVAIQHECDHLQGVMFVDHISTLKREVIRKRNNEEEIEALDPEDAFS